MNEWVFSYIKFNLSVKTFINKMNFLWLVIDINKMSLNLHQIVKNSLKWDEKWADSDI